MSSTHTRDLMAVLDNVLAQLDELREIIDTQDDTIRRQQQQIDELRHGRR